MRNRAANAAAALALLFLLATLLASQAAATRHIRIESQVTLSASNPFHGKVNSSPYGHACRPQRKVKVYNKQPGTDGLFGTTTTNQKGRWKMPASANGKFYALVKRQEQGTAGTIYVCKKATSPVVNF
jgi:hypothetical protein